MQPLEQIILLIHHSQNDNIILMKTRSVVAKIWGQGIGVMEQFQILNIVITLIYTFVKLHVTLCKKEKHILFEKK